MEEEGLRRAEDRRGMQTAGSFGLDEGLRAPTDQAGRRQNDDSLPKWSLRSRIRFLLISAAALWLFILAIFAWLI